MKKRAGIKSLFSSVQFKFALVFLVLIAGLLVMLNTYPTIVMRDLAFTSKQFALQNQSEVIASTLSTVDDLSEERVTEAMTLLNLRALTRIIVTDDKALVLYDTAELDSAVGRFALLDEIRRALNDEVVCYSVYDGAAFMTRHAMPIRRAGVTVGAVFLYEYDDEQAMLISIVQRNLRNITLILGAISIILMLVFSRALTLRITELVRATGIVSAGDYDHRISVRGNDELSELGDEFNKLTGRLKETEELRRRFVSDASHELKTPLASIRLLSDSIVNAGDMDRSTMLEFVTDIGSEADRLQRTAEKLLSLSWIDSGSEIEFTRLDVKSVIDKTLHPLKPLASENSVTILTRLEDNCVIYGNEDLIYRIIFNLAENSVKYNVPDGRVEISLFKSEDKVLLIIEDTGIGIPADDLPHIFSRFYRVDKARSRDAGGSGLGLSIVHDSVKIHGGEIEVERPEEGGTRFTVSFPACMDEDDEK